jgi:uncharacterized protein (DUF1697 family)
VDKGLDQNLKPFNGFPLNSASTGHRAKATVLMRNKTDTLPVGPLRTMSKYVAFLRAINVGGHTVKMDELRRLFESLGFSSVETFIASGNVVFDTKSKSTKALERKIETLLKQSLGYEVVTFVRTLSEVAGIAGYKPFDDARLNGEGNTVHVGFLNQHPSVEASKKLLGLSCEADSFHVQGREVYWLRCGNFSDSKFSGALIEKTLGGWATFRNSNTVRRIAAKYSSPAGN